MHKEELKTLPQSVINFLNYIVAIKDVSQLTVLEYASDLRMFFRFLLLHRKSVEQNIEFDSIDISGIDLNFIKTVTLQDAYDFLFYCKNERGNDVSARSRKAVSIRVFFKYLAKNMIINENPMQYLEVQKPKRSLPKYLTLDESINLLNSIDGKFKERDYCMITLFLNCGLRLSELVSLDYNDIRSDNTINIKGKGNKERTIYLNQMCLDAINDYMKVRPVEGVKDKNALFLSSRKTRISPKTVQYTVKTFLDKAGLSDKGFSTHKLRHTAATLMYQQGSTDVLTLKEFLGHENISTTEIYTHVNDAQVKEAVLSNPLNKSASKIKKTDE